MGDHFRLFHGTQASDQGRSKSKTELVEIAEKAFQMKIRRLTIKMKTSRR